MKSWLVGALAVVMLVGLSPTMSEAKRLGGGKSTGMQRDMPARTAPDAPPPKPATPAQSAQPAPGAQAVPGAAATAAAAPAKRSWLGPIAGLAAGLGIAALMSHLGLGEAFGNFLMLALLAVAAVFLIRFLVRKFAGGPAARPMQYAAAGASAGTGAPSSPVQVNWPSAGGSGGGAGSSAAPSFDAPRPTQAFVPASFDSEGFERAAKMIFIRMQAANDAGNLDDLRSFTTPEMFASVKLDLLERGATAQQTEVLSVRTQVLDVAEEGGNQVVSVRFQGQVREEAGAAPVDFNEVWHLVKPADDSRSWAIAGIEQSH